MIIDKRGKLFGKINVIDLFVILFVIMAVIVTAVKFGGVNKKTDVDTNATIEYVLKVKDVRGFSAKQFVKGENIYDDELGKNIGQITDIKIENAEDFAVKSDGSYNKSIKPEKYDVYITVETKGTIDDKGYFADGVRQISPYSTIIISNKRVKTTSTVYSVAKKN